MTSDQGIHEQIADLSAQEHRVREQLGKHEIAPAVEQARLRELEVQLDQAWDLLRQRQALRDAGESPARAQVRPAADVEGYLG